ncbi:MAG TPA: hypothetical protein VLC92_09580 [Rhodocyclaceae bacterium]|nr:hypothetical protein [Rhodocyclaceae bacterium]
MQTKTIQPTCGPNENGFTTFTLEEIAEFLVAHEGELDMEGTTAEEVLERVRSGQSALEVRSWGFALIQLAIAKGVDERIPHLWVLYVAEGQRGKGRGAVFMRELLRKYSSYFHMSLYCHGPRRRKFFGRFGFRVESRDGEMRRMTTNPTPW